MLAVVVFIAVGAFRNLRPYLERFGENVAQTFERRLSGGLHEVRLGR